mmetsp:Transcript_8676/g.27509  ORF Transcript_8676/g.27509 Transcript_8676/m.27509 type:complete len:292 (-) Transcript_8676:4-879(-)
MAASDGLEELRAQKARSRRLDERAPVADIVDAREESEERDPLRLAAVVHDKLEVAAVARRVPAEQRGDGKRRRRREASVGGGKTKGEASRTEASVGMPREEEALRRTAAKQTAQVVEGPVAKDRCRQVERRLEPLEYYVVKWRPARAARQHGQLAPDRGCFAGALLRLRLCLLLLRRLPCRHLHLPHRCLSLSCCRRRHPCCRLRLPRRHRRLLYRLKPSRHRNQNSTRQHGDDRESGQKTRRLFCTQASSPVRSSPRCATSQNGRPRGRTGRRRTRTAYTVQEGVLACSK